jgi:hypothetical protein
MKLFKIIFPLLFCCCCQHVPQHMKEGYAIIHSHHKEMVEAAKWIPVAIGGSYYGGDIKCLSTDFEVIQEAFEVEKARELIIEGTQKFLKSINTNPHVTPHLNHYPFTSKDLDYSVGIVDKDFNLLGHVFICKGKVLYSKTDPSENLCRVHEESYEEALERVGNTVTPSPSSASPNAPKPSSPPPATSLSSPPKDAFLEHSLLGGVCKSQMITVGKAILDELK